MSNQPKVITEEDLDRIELGFEFYEKVRDKYCRCMIVGDFYGINISGSSGTFNKGSHTIEGFLTNFNRKIEYLRESVYTASTPESIKMTRENLIDMIKEDMKLMPNHRKFLKDYDEEEEKVIEETNYEVGDGFSTFEDEFYGSVDPDHLGG